MWHCVEHIWREKVMQDEIGLMTESVLLAEGLITGPALYLLGTLILNIYVFQVTIK